MAVKTWHCQTGKIMDPYFLEITSVKIIMGITIGLILGSFITMLSYRLPNKISIVKPRSKCTKCNTTLEIIDLIPVFSWIINKGKCRHCKNKIGARYIIIEIITTIITALSFMIIGFHFALIPALLIMIMLITFIITTLERLN